MSSAAPITLADLACILPLLLLTGAALLLMFQVMLRRHHASAATLSIFGMLACLGSIPPIIDQGLAAGPRMVTPLLLIDAWVLYCWVLLLLVALAVAAMAWSYWRHTGRRMEELYILLLCATLGACVLVASRHFAALFLGLELMTIALIAMLGYPLAQKPDTGAGPLEAALKYLILSAVSSAVLLFGMALLYAETGSLDFSGMLAHLEQEPVQDLYLLTGLTLLVAGVGFKLSLVPFHLWTPDVYQGAPLPVTALIATLSKGAVLGLLLRFVLLSELQAQPLLLGVLAVVAVASMLGGNLLALLQDDPKRLLAYSSIAHMGYVMLAPLLASSFAMEAMGLYLAAYLLMTLGAFAALAVLSGPEQEPGSLADLRGCLWQQPLAAGVLALMLLSLAGIPLTVGFIGKFYLVGSAVQGQLWGPLAALVLGSVLGLFYYLRVVVIMMQAPPSGQPLPPRPRAELTDRMLLLACGLAVIALGILPGFLLALLRNLSLAAI